MRDPSQGESIRVTRRAPSPDVRKRPARALVTARHDILGLPPAGRVALARIPIFLPPEPEALAEAAVARFLEISEICCDFSPHLKPFSNRAPVQDMLHGVCHARKTLEIGE